MSDETGKYSRVTAIVSWYDEPLELLTASISSLAGVVDHVVAVDGGYFLFPDAKPSSDPTQARVIEEVCRGMRVGLTLHVPGHVWGGNEVQKRNHAVQLAEAVTREDGWYYVHDADTVVTNVVYNWFERLDEIRDENWGAISVGVREVIPGLALEDVHAPCRLMYRALKGMQYGPAHWVLHAPDPLTGEYICFWGPVEYRPIDAYDGTSLLQVDHRRDRSEDRTVRARKYYVRREQFGVERTKKVHTERKDGSFHPVTKRTE